MKDDPEIVSLVERIADLCDGLIFVSETDSPLEPVALADMREISESSLRRSAGIPGDTKIETSSPADLFERLAAERAWHDREEAAQARGFERLREVLEKELRAMKVFRVHGAKMDIYILGKTPSGIVAGVRTQSVET